MTTTKTQDLVGFGDKIDLILDLTGDADTSHVLRMGMLKNNNLHTVVTRRADLAPLKWTLRQRVFQIHLVTYNPMKSVTSRRCKSRYIQ